VDMLTIVGHKYGAPKGVSALYIRDATAVALSPILGRFIMLMMMILMMMMMTMMMMMMMMINFNSYH